MIRMIDIKSYLHSNLLRLQVPICLLLYRQKGRLNLPKTQKIDIETLLICPEAKQRVNSDQ